MAAAVLPLNIPGFNPQVTPPKVQFPAGATDCHAHVFGPQSAFPYVQRAVLLQPSTYGSDNSCMVAAFNINIVIDHFAKCQAANGVNGPAFQALRRLVKRDNVWAKI